ncbi:hypothetical protein MGG_17676 [Pyricularia oryzae 70-15]|uniref:Uncharacterized protein n=1 Tax=Pyricularia oryzae (strain 70-15 / ATCC MYA-4617 / FGSC 8958) TaxID=242507 RepID=G4NIP5_PYRO7|nr:uncharacterized protein MGG_17676 [Pyricularia oryzae 70-15]EHA47301.1 hypothetical protein MGG_17676 [Pyricularia oryzae 70-15]
MAAAKLCCVPPRRISHANATYSAAGRLMSVGQKGASKSCHRSRLELVVIKTHEARGMIVPSGMCIEGIIHRRGAKASDSSLAAIFMIRKPRFILG